MACHQYTIASDTYYPMQCHICPILITDQMYIKWDEPPFFFMISMERLQPQSNVSMSYHANDRGNELDDSYMCLRESLLDFLKEMLLVITLKYA